MCVKKCDRQRIVFLLVAAAAVTACAGKRISEVSGADNLLGNFRRLQYLAPPVRAGDVLDYDVGYVIIDAADKSWPDRLIQGLIPEAAADGSESWPFTLSEDALTHRTCLLNAAGKTIHEVKAPGNYNPEWIASGRLNLNSSKNTPERRRKYAPLLAPSRIKVSGRFVLEEHPKAKEYFAEKNIAHMNSASGSARAKNHAGVKGRSSMDLHSMISSLSMGAQSMSVPGGLEDQSGISGENPGFPPPGYKDYLYVQIGTEKPFILETAKNVRSLARVSNCTLIVFDDGSVKGLGYDPRTYDFCSATYADMGIKWGVNWFTPPPYVTDVAAVAPGPMNYFMFLQNSGDVLGWGQELIAEGRGNVPSSVENAVAIANVFDYAGAVLDDGRVELWGDYCPDAFKNSAAGISNATGVVDGCAFSAFSVVLLQDGTLTVIGSDNAGQASVPANVINVAQVAAGGSHVLALLDDGSVIAWGDNFFGQTNVPASVAGAVGVAAGDAHSLAVLDDGSVVAWGAGDYGATNVPAYVSNAIYVGAVDNQGHALLADGSASIWGGSYYTQDAPDEPISTIAQDFSCRVLQLAYSDSCQPSLMTAIIRAPAAPAQGALDGDADGDGLMLFDETYLFETDPDLRDSDGDGLSDGAETAAGTLALWNAADPAGTLDMRLHVTQVTATDNARAALLKDGTVLIFEGDGASLLTHTYNCGAVSIDASDEWIIACLESGDVNVWAETAGGGYSVNPLGVSGAVQISGGQDHALVRFADGTVKIFKEDFYDQPVEDTSTFCSAITNAVHVAAGDNSDVMLLEDGTALAMDATYNSLYRYEIKPDNLRVTDIVPGNSRYYAVLYSDGTAKAFYGNTQKAATLSGIITLYSDKENQFIAVADNGTNYHYTRGASAWSTSAVANDLTDLGKLWWRRGCGLEITTNGVTTVLQSATPLDRRLKVLDAAVTPGTADRRGIAVVVTGTNPHIRDTDGDGIADGWEVLYNYDPNDPSDPPADPEDDHDGDGLDTLTELALGTDPFNPDSDGDGYSDGWEVAHSNAVYSFNPLDPLDTVSDEDNDGLSRARECVYGTSPHNPDSDGDGLGDGQETETAFLALWSGSDRGGSIMLGRRAVQAVASETARAALLADGKVLIFTGDGPSLTVNEYNCGAVSIDASDKWIIACLADGNVNIWLVKPSGAITPASLGVSGAVEVAGGYEHCLVRFANGTVSVFYENTTDLPIRDTTTFCSGINTAVKIRAGRICDAVFLANGDVWSGDARSTTSYKLSAIRPGLAVADVVPGYNRYYAVLFANGDAEVFYGSTRKAAKLSGIAAIYSDGDRQFLAVAADGTNRHYTYNTSAWSTSAVTEDLRDAAQLWWRRACAVKISDAGTLTSIQNASVSTRPLKFMDAAVTPGTSDRGIALVVSGTDPLDPDTDGDLLPDGWEVLIGYNPAATSNLSVDSDGDGMYDWFELLYGLDTAADDSGADPDEDGLTNDEEFAFGINDPTKATDPNNPDTDGDELKDGEEVYGNHPENTHGYITLPYDPDSDDDGLTDGAEILNKYGIHTDPNNPDSDGDDLSDGFEVNRVPPLNPHYPDSDGDTMWDGWEIEHGFDPNLVADGGDNRDDDDLNNAGEFAAGSDPDNPDSDNDGLTDGEEVHGSHPHNTNGYTSSPILKDTDGDGIDDDKEIFGTHPGNTFLFKSDPKLADTDGEGMTDLEEILGSYPGNVSGYMTDPRLADTDGDGMTDLEEILGSYPGNSENYVSDPRFADTDGDTIPDLHEILGTYPGNSEGYASDPKLADTDGDTIPDLYEIFGTYPGNSEGYASDPKLADTDGDTIPDLHEILGTYPGNSEGYVSDPKLADTDGDMIPDLHEILGTYPGNSAAYVSDPRFADTDGDNLSDKAEIVGENPGGYKSNPRLTDTDGDGLRDDVEVNHIPAIDPNSPDTDGDKMRDGDELDWIPPCDPSNIDSDGDTMPDGWEVTYGLNPMDSHDAAGDIDEDGLSNRTEYGLGLDPTNADTDYDGMPDGWEHDHGLDARSGLSDSLIGWWQFREGSGTVSADLSGNGNDAVIVLQVQHVQWNAEAEGDTLPMPSLLFNPDFAINNSGGESGGYVCVEGLTDVPLAGGFTMSAWIRMFSSSPYAAILTKASDLWLLQDGTAINMHNPGFSAGQRNYDTTARMVPPPPLGQWAHLCGVYDPETATVKLYVNGNESSVISDISPVANVSKPLWIGSVFKGYTSYPFFGNITDVRFYSAVLSQDAIKEMLEFNDDLDGDGLSNYNEFIIGTDPSDLDSDDDDLTDGQELSAAINTNPLDPDTDGDGIPDGMEYNNGLDPNTPSPDADNDDLSNETEMEIGTSPVKWDTDMDGLGDGEEVNVYRTDPTKPDSDGDTLLDGEEVYGNAVQNIHGYTSDPNLPDTDDDGLSDWHEVIMYYSKPRVKDTDGDTLIDGYEVEIHTSPVLVDTDGDYLDDLFEIEYDRVPYDLDPVVRNLDPDNDRLSTDRELGYGSDPIDEDSDDDGLLDGEETYQIYNNWNISEEYWFDVSGGINVLESGNPDLDDGCFTVALPFPIYFGGTVRSNITLSVNGALYLLNPDVNPPPSIIRQNYDFADENMNKGHTFIAAYWDDLKAFPETFGSSITVAESVTNGSRYCVIEYSNIGFYNSTSSDKVSFQIQIAENLTNEVVMVYRLAPDRAHAMSGSATIGFQGNSEFQSHVYYHNQEGSIGFDQRLRFNISYGTSPLIADMDGDGLTDGAEIKVHHTDPFNPDTDGDGMPDGWEIDNTLNPNDPSDANIDFDGDTLSNLYEFYLGTNPRLKDSDGDGYEDGDELAHVIDSGTPGAWYDVSGGTDLLEAMNSTDGNGFTTVVLPFAIPYNGNMCTEIGVSENGAIYILTPGEPVPMGAGSYNTDLSGSLVSANHVFVAPFWDDLKAYSAMNSSITMNEIINAAGNKCVIEYKNMGFYGGTSADVVSFQMVFTESFTNKLVVNYGSVTGLGNGSSASIGIQGRSVFQRASYAFNMPGSIVPGLSLTFNLGMGTSAADADTDCDGLSDYDELNIYGTDPLQPDTDGDGLSDGWEVANQFDPNVHNVGDGIAGNDPGDDPDGDGLTNSEEDDYGTSSSAADLNSDGIPDGRDTDGDGVDDGTEIEQGSDPLNAESKTAGDCVKAQFRFGDHSGSHSEKYRITITPMLGVDPRGATTLRNSAYGDCETKTNALYKGEEYEVKLFHSGTDPDYDGSPSPDYDYTLTISVSGAHQIYDEHDMLGSHDESDSLYASGKKVVLRVVDVDLEIYKPKVIDPDESMIPESEEEDVGSMTFVNLDNDDNDQFFDHDPDDELRGDAYVSGGDDELVKLRLKVRPKTLTSGSINLNAMTGSEYIKVYKNHEKWFSLKYTLGDSISLLGDFKSESDALVTEMWVEGIKAHTVQQGTRLRLSCSLNGTVSEDVSLTVVGVEKVEWQKGSDDQILEDDPNWAKYFDESSDLPTGLRVFPGKYAPDGDAHDIVKVSVSLSVAPPYPLTVFLRAFDVDDPSFFDSIVDSEEHDQDNNVTRLNRDADSLVGPLIGEFSFIRFPGEDSSEIKSLLLGADEKEKSCNFIPSIYPGDNFRIAASGDYDFLLTLANPDSLVNIGADDSEKNIHKQLIVCKKVPLVTDPSRAEVRLSGNYCSSTLTIWRKLWIERDSMMPMPEDERVKVGLLDKDLTTTHENYSKIGYAIGPNPSFQRNELEGGNLIFKVFTGSDTCYLLTPQGNMPCFKIFRNYTEYESSSPESECWLPGETYPVGNILEIWPPLTSEQQSAIRGSNFNVVIEFSDDDDVTIFDQPVLLSMDASIPLYNEAYIEPVYADTFNTTINVEFKRQVSFVDAVNLFGKGFIRRSQDLHSERLFWANRVVACFEPHTSLFVYGIKGPGGIDYDPDSEFNGDINGGVPINPYSIILDYLPDDPMFGVAPSGADVVSYTRNNALIFLETFRDASITKAYSVLAPESAFDLTVSHEVGHCAGPFCPHYEEDIPKTLMNPLPEDFVESKTLGPRGIDHFRRYDVW